MRRDREYLLDMLEAAKLALAYVFRCVGCRNLSVTELCYVGL